MVPFTSFIACSIFSRSPLIAWCFESILILTLLVWSLKDHHLTQALAEGDGKHRIPTIYARIDFIFICLAVTEAVIGWGVESLSSGFDKQELLLNDPHASNFIFGL